MDSTTEVDKKIKAGHYNTKSKQGKSDSWMNVLLVTDKDGMSDGIDLQRAKITLRERAVM